MKRVTIILAALLLAGCGQAANGTVPPTTTPAPGQTVVAATDTPAPGAATLEKVGAVVDVQCGGSDCLHVSIDKVQFATSYKAQYYTDTPAPGNVYLAFQVTYKAVGPNASYSVGDWQVYVNDQVANTTTVVVNGPKPELLIGQLPQGKSVAGWIVEEVAKTGKVVIDYMPLLSQPVFEVVARAK